MTTTDAPSTATRVDPRTGAVLTGPEGLPARTLGWAVLAWTVQFLRQPDGPDAGKPWRFSAEQVRFLLWWYALDALGRFTFRRAVLRRSKGWGKDPIAAALALVEFLGPCRYSGTDANGDPIAIPHPSAWVQLAAVSEAQTTNTMSLVLGMLEGSPAVEVYGLDIGKTIIYSRTGKLQTVTSSPRSMEGNRPSLVILNESQHWLSSNDGHTMAAVIRRNLGKSRDGSGRSVEICNAHRPGEDSTAEKSHEAWQAITEGRSQAAGLLYDSREAPADVDMSNPDDLRRGLVAAYGDSVAWIDLDRIAGEIWDPDTSPGDARRFYLNQVASADDAWVRAHEWDACAASDALAPGNVVVIGGDGSRSDDSTALAVCRVGDGLLDLAAVWEQPDGPAADRWEVPRTEVDDMVGYLFARYRVLAMYFDVAGWESYVDKWSVEYSAVLAVKAATRSAVGWDMRSRTKEFVQRGAQSMHAAILDGTLAHTGHPILRRHTLNARRRPNRWGVGWGKEHRESARKVDALAAATLARIARQDVLAAGADRVSDRSGEVWAF